jgi:hypothetical protein
MERYIYQTLCVIILVNYKIYNNKKKKILRIVLNSKNMNIDCFITQITESVENDTQNSNTKRRKKLQIIS